ncbi:hypothetical protein CO704_10005 [Cedecea neteri]|uniref:Uncharacterized protein n=1 Tax=Cedecea neteri TaxID=158822 RepID=A0A291DXP2_9ENTR|nr:hypothetical protein CO704_10005 [Cedecea neteri]
MNAYVLTALGRIKWAFNTIGAYPVFLSAFIGGVYGALTTKEISWVILTCMMFFALVERFYRQQKAHIEKRSQGERKQSFIKSAFISNLGHQLIILDEFKYNGVLFKVIAFYEIPIAQTIAGPLCPRCHHRLTERLRIRFFVLTDITLHCCCGFSYASKHTIIELVKEVETHKNLI